MTSSTWNDWDNQRDAQDSLDAIHSKLGCPILLVNGYRMDEWDFVTKSAVQDRWGFVRVRARPGTTVAFLESGLKSGRVLRNKRPDDWYPEEQV